MQLGAESDEIPIGRGVLQHLRLSSAAAVSLAGIASLITLSAWAVASPVGASPDDDFHLASIYCATSGGNDLCLKTDDPGTRNVAVVLLKAQCFAFNPDASAACQMDQGIIGNHKLVETSRGNFAGQYPGMFYSTLAIFAGDNVESSVVAMRLFNSVLFVVLGGALALLFPKRWRNRIGLMWLTTLVPLGLFLIPSTNPSSWAITGIGTAFAALVGMLSSRGWRRLTFAGLYAVGGLLAAGARADSAVYLIIATIVALGLTARKADFRSPWMVFPLAVVCGGFISFFTAGQSIVGVSGLVDSEGSVATHSPAAIFFGNLLNVPSLWLGVFGSWNLGWLDTQMPVIVWTCAGGVFAIFVFLSWRGLARRELLWSAGVGLALVVIPIYILQKSLAPVGAQVQPRYILPLIVLLAGVIFLSKSNWAFDFSWAQWAFIGAALILAQSVALFLNIRRYTSGTAGGVDLNHDVGWWWPTMISPMGIWGLGSLSFVVVVIVILLTAKTPQHSKVLAHG